MIKFTKMPRRCGDWFQLISSATGTALGGVMFILFLFVWGNYAAGVWALLTGIFAAILFHLTYLHFCDILDTWHNIETLHGITFLGVLVSLAGAGGFIWYLFHALYYHIPALPISGSSYIASAWAAITMKYGLMLICTSCSYMGGIYRESTPLLPS